MTMVVATSKLSSNFMILCHSYFLIDVKQTRGCLITNSKKNCHTTMNYRNCHPTKFQNTKEIVCFIYFVVCLNYKLVPGPHRTDNSWFVSGHCWLDLLTVAVRRSGIVYLVSLPVSTDIMKLLSHMKQLKAYRHLHSVMW